MVDLCLFFFFLFPQLLLLLALNNLHHHHHHHIYLVFTENKISFSVFINVCVCGVYVWLPSSSIIPILIDASVFVFHFTYTQTQKKFIRLDFYTVLKQNKNEKKNTHFQCDDDMDDMCCLMLFEKLLAKQSRYPMQRQRKKIQRPKKNGIEIDHRELRL